MLPFYLYYDAGRRQRGTAATTKAIATAQSKRAEGGALMRLRIQRPPSFAARFRLGMYAMLRVPALNAQWHPFMLSSCSGSG